MKRLGTALIVTLLAMPAAALASPSQLPDHAAEKVAAAQERAAYAASSMAAEKARGRNDDKTTGLARAAEVSNSWKFTGAGKPGNGNAFGVGRSDDVHAALAAGVSPSSLPSHGEAVSDAAHEMTQAFNGMKAKPESHPGKGQNDQGEGD